MIFPASSQTTLGLLVLSMICWGSWANTQRLAGKWRFELYYYDFAVGFLLVTVAAAFTFGSWNASELTFQENYLITGYRNMAYALAAGMVFNAGNLFLAAAVSVAGLSVAFPIALGTALVVSTAYGVATGGSASVLLAAAGAGLVLVALVVAAYAYTSHLDALAEAAKQVALQLDPRSKQAPHPASAALPVVLGVVSGIALGLFHSLVDLAQAGENGLASYGLALLFAGGVMATTVLLSPFFFNFPVAGNPLQLSDYLDGSGREHLLGIFGGVLAGAALLAGFVTSGVPATARVAPATSFALNQGGVLLAALWGLLVWREFKGSGHRIYTLFGGMLLLFALGIAVLAVGQG